jgi:hypothetical protein
MGVVSVALDPAVSLQILGKECFERTKEDDAVT